MSGSIDLSLCSNYKSILLSSAICSYNVFFRFISRNVRLKRQRYFIKHLSNSQAIGGLGFVKGSKRIFKRFIFRRKGFSLRLLYFRKLGMFLYGSKELIMRLQQSKWRSFLFTCKLILRRQSTKLLQDIMLQAQYATCFFLPRQRGDIDFYN